mgnify:CR=1 FL=1
MMAVPETTPPTNEPSTVGKITDFFKESKVELKKVTWPTRRELFANTVVVLVAFLIWVADSIFSLVIRTILR